MLPSRAIVVTCLLAGLAGVAAVAAHGPVGASAPAQVPTPSPTSSRSPTAAARTVTPSPTVYGAQTLTAEHRASATRTGTATATPTARATIEPGTCLAITDKLAAEQAFLGDTIGITMTMRAMCAGPRFPVHVVLVMDGSAAMSGQPSRDMRVGAIEMVRELDTESHPSTKLAVVEFQDRARRLCDLTNDESRVLSCIRRVGARGDTSIAKGLQEAQRVMRQGRLDLHRYDRATEIVVVFSQGCYDACCDEAVQGSRDLRSEGVLMISVCIGRECQEHCMRQLASSSRYFHYVEDMRDLLDLLNSIQNRIINIGIKLATVTDRVPDHMRYVPGSADPEPTLIGPGRDVLVWQDVYVPVDGITYTFEVEPLELGRHETNVEAQVELVSGIGVKGTSVFPVPTVWVRARPTATASTAATATPSRAASATLTPPSVQSPTPTPRRSSLWLPSVLQAGR